MAEVPRFVVVGAGSRDQYLNPDLPQELWLPGEHLAGEKPHATEADIQHAAMLTEMHESGELREAPFRESKGGNGPNAARRLAQLRDSNGQPRYDVHHLTASGGAELDQEIADDLHAHGVTPHAITREGHVTSVSYISRKRNPKGGYEDREIRGVRRSPFHETLQPEHYQQHFVGADAIAVSSLKSVISGHQVVDAVIQEDQRRGKPVFYAPLYGSSEFKDHPADLLEMSSRRRIDHLAANDAEFAALFQGDAKDHQGLLDEALRYADNVTLTLGHEGLWLAGTEFDPLFIPSEFVPSRQIVDTTGAGDSIFAHFTDVFFRAHRGEKVDLEYEGLVGAAIGATVIRSLGSCGDIKLGA